MINYKVNDNNKYLPAEGGTLSGDLNMSGRLIKNVASPVDDSDIVNYSTLNTKLASTDPYKVGDILYTARTDLGDKWALCNGSIADNDTTISNLMPLNFMTSWDVSKIYNTKNLSGYTLITDDLKAYTVDLESAGSFRRLHIRCCSDLMKNPTKDLYLPTSGYGYDYQASIISKYIYDSNDGYVTIAVSFNSSNTTYSYIFRINKTSLEISTIDVSSNTDLINKYHINKSINNNFKCYIKLGKYYYYIDDDTYRPNIYRTTAFGLSGSRIFSNTGSFINPIDSYYDKDTGKVLFYQTDTQGRQNIISYNENTNTINSMLWRESFSYMGNSSVSKYFEWFAKDEKTKDIYCYCAYTANSSTSGMLGKVDLVNNTVIQVQNSIRPLCITFDHKIPYYNEEYYNIIPGANKSSYRIFKGSTYPIPASSSYADIYGSFNYAEEVESRCVSYLSINDTQSIYINLNKGVFNADLTKFVYLPTISSDKSYVYIKVKE